MENKKTNISNARIIETEKNLFIKIMQTKKRIKDILISKNELQIKLMDLLSKTDDKEMKALSTIVDEKYTLSMYFCDKDGVVSKFMENYRKDDIQQLYTDLKDYKRTYYELKKARINKEKTQNKLQTKNEEETL